MKRFVEALRAEEAYDYQYKGDESRLNIVAVTLEEIYSL